ncbi:hypothetical protein KGK29_004572 [Salmonella enterica]|nr:hypothetical protein [Salmonella enterica]
MHSFLLQLSKRNMKGKVMNEINAKKTPVAQAMSKPEGYILEDDTLSAGKKEQQKRKTGYRKLKPGEGKKIVLAIMVYLINSLSKSIMYFPLMLFFCIMTVFMLIPADVLFQIKTEWVSLNMRDFSHLLEIVRTIVWDVWLVTFVSVVVTHLHQLNFLKKSSGGCNE